MGREARRKQSAAAERGKAEEAPEETKTEDGATDAKGRKEKAPKGRVATELGVQAGTLVCALILAVLGVVALVAPDWGIPLGTLLGGGNQVTLTALATDGSEPSADDVASAASTLQKRADTLYQMGVSVEKQSDSEIVIKVPSAYDASAVASSISGVGKVELVRVDTISDADALAQIEAGTTDVALAEGSYEAFATNDNITDASVVSSTSSYYTTSGTSTTVWGVGFSLDSATTKTLEEVTDELKDSYGRIAVVVDGVAVTAPQISSKLEGGQVTVSGSFTQDEAYGLASEFKTGAISVSLVAAEPTELKSAFDGNGLVVTVAAYVLAAIVAGIVCARLFGRTGWLAAPALLVQLALELGIMAVLARFDLVIAGNWELGGLLVCAIISLVTSVRVASTYHKSHEGGSSVRKAQQDACDAAFADLVKVEIAIVVVFICCAIWFDGHLRELSCALAAGFAADLVCVPLVKVPLLKVLSAGDAEPSLVVAAAAAESEEKGKRGKRKATKDKDAKADDEAPKDAEPEDAESEEAAEPEDAEPEDAAEVETAAEAEDAEPESEVEDSAEPEAAVASEPETEDEAAADEAPAAADATESDPEAEAEPAAEADTAAEPSDHAEAPAPDEE